MLRYLAAAIAATGLCLLAACGSGDSPDGRSSIVVEASDPGEKMAIAAPASVDAGEVQVTLTNRGDTPHDAQLFRVDGKHSGQDVAMLLETADSAPKPGWLHLAGGVAPIDPGESGMVTAVLEPGTYYIADTQERETESGARITGAARGGIAKLEVEGEGGGRLPATPARITAKDTGFQTAGIRPGRNRVTFENRGKEPHQAVAFRVDDEVPFAKAEETLMTDKADIGWVPVDVPAARATTVLDSGGEQISEMTFEPGRYALVCFVSDRAGGPPHFQEGMVSELNVSSETARQGAGAR